MELDYPVSKFEADNDLNDPSVMQKYRMAGDIANECLQQVLAKIAPEVAVHDLCQYGDDLIEAHTSKVFQQQHMQKGVALPTSVTVNNLVEYFAPSKETTRTLNVGDVVKIELGVHLDGYIATTAHTTIVAGSAGSVATGPVVNVICAAHYASEAVLKMLKPGQKASDISRIIHEVASIFRCQPVAGTTSNQLKRFVLQTQHAIVNRYPKDITVKEVEESDFVIEGGQVYSINVVMTTGSGEVKEGEDKPMIYARNVHQNYNLKTKSARTAFNEINERFSVFPFSTRALNDKRARLGLGELVSHNLLTPYPITRSANNADIVAQFKLTVLLTPQGPLRITVPQPLPYIHSEYSIPAEADVARILSTGDIRVAKAPAGLPSVNVAFGAIKESLDVEMT